MYKYLSKYCFNEIILNYDKKTLTINYLNNELEKIASYKLKLKYTKYLDNIFNLFFNFSFKKELKKLNYKISLQVIKNY